MNLDKKFPDSSGLTIKQKLFCSFYLESWNGVQSAKAAGYSGSYSALGVTSHRLLKNTKIKAEIARRLTAAAMSADECLYHLAAIGRDYSRNDQLKALELLGKHLSIFENTQKIALTVETVTTEQLNELDDGQILALANGTEPKLIFSEVNNE
jgi:phage terminase small subunit